MTKPSAVSFIAMILIDLPVWVHSWLAADRLIKSHAGQLENAPGGHRDPPPTKAFFGTFNEVDQNWMPYICDQAALAERQGSRYSGYTL
jgi:hypothetical protein